MFSELIFTIKQLSLIFPKVATDKVAGKLSSTLSWVKNSVSLTVSQMASQVATPSSLHTTVASSMASLSSPSSASPTLLSPDDVELLAKLEEQNRYECFTQCPLEDLFQVFIFSVCQSTTLEQLSHSLKYFGSTIWSNCNAYWVLHHLCCRQVAYANKYILF